MLPQNEPLPVLVEPLSGSEIIPRPLGSFVTIASVYNGLQLNQSALKAEQDADSEDEREDALMC